ncbi:hypothetical protein FQA39_LY04972 [Lamprigera yunnana]|nr:hypothetical protein FQA39_LY04972 [Lamprigera yunnana]
MFAINFGSNSAGDNVSETVTSNIKNDNINSAQNTGRGFIDIAHLFSSLKLIYHEGFDYSFFDVNIIREKRFELRSVFTYKCEVCGKTGSFNSKDNNTIRINKSVVTGVIATGGGKKQNFRYC